MNSSMSDEKILRFELEEGGLVCLFGFPFKYIEVPIN